MEGLWVRWMRAELAARKKAELAARKKIGMVAAAEIMAAATNEESVMDGRTRRGKEESSSSVKRSASSMVTAAAQRDVGTLGARADASALEESNSTSAEPMELVARHDPDFSWPDAGVVSKCDGSIVKLLS